VGYAAVGGTSRASLWSGTAASWVNLDPAGYSVAVGVDDGVQVGSMRTGGDRAALWRGTPGSYVNLHPAGATTSFAYDVGSGQQVGYAVVGGWARASLWRGTPTSWEDLNPPGATYSYANGVGGGQQVGRAGVGGETHAILWSSTAASWVDLNPLGAPYSYAGDVYSGQQVGQAEVGGVQRASLWKGTSASWVDLHAILPAGFSSSLAEDVWDDGVSTYVVGFGRNSTTGRDEALVWVGPRPCESSVSFASQPSSVALVPGGSAPFSIDVNGTPSAIRWRRNGVDLADGPRVSGSATATLTVSSVQASDQGEYDCVVSSACNTVTSNPATLSCAPILVGQPPERALLVPGQQLGVTAPTGALYSYRWRRNAQDLFNFPGYFSGVTTRTLTLLSGDPSLEGGYDVVVTNSCGVVTSETAQVLCLADFNCSGGTPDDADVAAFFDAWNNGDDSADVNGSGGTPNDADVAYFFERWSAGC